MIVRFRALMARRGSPLIFGADCQNDVRRLTVVNIRKCKLISFLVRFCGETEQISSANLFLLKSCEFRAQTMKFI